METNLSLIAFEASKVDQNPATAPERGGGHRSTINQLRGQGLTLPRKTGYSGLLVVPVRIFSVERGATPSYSLASAPARIRESPR